MYGPSAYSLHDAVAEPIDTCGTILCHQSEGWVLTNQMARFPKRWYIIEDDKDHETFIDPLPAQYFQLERLNNQSTLFPYVTEPPSTSLPAPTYQSPHSLHIPTQQCPPPSSQLPRPPSTRSRCRTEPQLSPSRRSGLACWKNAEILTKVS